MSTSVPTPTGTRIPRPSVPGRTSTGTTTAGPTGADAAPVRTGGGPGPTRYAMVVLASVVLSVAASVSVVALTGPDPEAPAPAPVTGPGPVEEDAGRALDDYGFVREGAFCPVSSSPPAAC